MKTLLACKRCDTQVKSTGPPQENRQQIQITLMEEIGTHKSPPQIAQLELD